MQQVNDPHGPPSSAKPAASAGSSALKRRLAGRVTVSTDHHLLAFFQETMPGNFPFVIQDVAEVDIATAIFRAMAHFDTETLLKCRLMSTGWRDFIDKHTTLWSRMPLWKAAEENRLDICETIVKYAKEKNPVRPIFSTGWSVLHEAADEGLFEVCKLIIDQLDVKNPPDTLHGDTPLHEAAQNGHLDICRYIMDRVVEKNPTNISGRTPLHLAAISGQVEVCRLFLDTVDDVNPVDHFGDTPLSVAEDYGHEEICQMIRNKMNPQE